MLPEADFNGTDSFTYTVTDSDGFASNVATAVLTDLPVNDRPTFTGGADQAVDEDAGPQTVAAWATGIDARALNESGQLLTFRVAANTNPGLFSASPAADASTGDLTYTPANNANGVATITLELADDGGTANGGQDTSAAELLTITVNPVNDAPVAANDGPFAVDEGATFSYLGSDLAAGLISNEAFSEFQIRHFEVLDEFSAMTGSPEKTLA